jgi:predicted nucleic acid-binding protein
MWPDTCAASAGGGIMLFDTDVLIWALRGNRRAASAIDQADRLQVSAVSYMELLKGARDKRDQKATQAFLRDLGFEMLPVTAGISHRAVIYMEEFVLSAGLELADALIAATAGEHGLDLCTANVRHYRVIADLNLKGFRPE